MPLIFTAATRLRSLSTLAALALASTASAQGVGQTLGSPPHDGRMMGDGLGWGMGYGMGGYGFVGVFVLALVVIAVAVLAFRRRQP